MYNFDPDSPIQDADIEYSELILSARREKRIEKKFAICLHNWYRTYPVVKCNDCGKVFKSEKDLHEERRELLI